MRVTLTGPPSSSPVMTELGLPYPRSRMELAALTRAAAGSFRSRRIATRPFTDSLVYCRALQRIKAELGRAPCRERVCQNVYITVDAVSFKNKNEQTRNNILRYINV